MMMPTQPGTNLIVVHPQSIPALLNGRLDGPAQADHTDQVSDRCLCWSIAEIDLELTFCSQRTAEDDPDMLDMLAEVHEKSGNLPEAIRTLEKAVDLPKANPFLEVTLSSYRQGNPTVVSFASAHALLDRGKMKIIIVYI